LGCNIHLPNFRQIKVKVDSLIQQYIETKQFSGCVLVAKDNEVLYQYAFSYASRRTSAEHIATNFNIASMANVYCNTYYAVGTGRKNVLNQTHLLPEYKIKKADSITVRSADILRVLVIT
jgi:hypothetical protein